MSQKEKNTAVQPLACSKIDTGERLPNGSHPPSHRQKLVPALVANLSAQTLWVKSTLADANNHRHFLLKLRFCRMRNTSPGVPFRKRLVPFKFPFESESFFLESWTQSPLLLFPLPLDLPFAAAPEVGFPSCRSREEKCFLRMFCSKVTHHHMFQSLVLSRDSPF